MTQAAAVTSLCRLQQRATTGQYAGLQVLRPSPYCKTCSVNSTEHLAHPFRVRSVKCDLSVGSPSLQNLPPKLLVRVCSNLSLQSQSSLFSCSKILHDRWKLHVLEDDEAWQFVSWGIDVLARNPSEGCSKDDGSISMHFEQADFKQCPAKISCQQCPAKISCQHAEQSFVLQLSGLIQICEWLYEPGGQLVQRKLYGIGCLTAPQQWSLQT